MRSPLPFLQNWKKVPRFWEKCQLWPSVGYISHAVLRVFNRKNPNFTPGVFLFCVLYKMFIEVPSLQGNFSALKDFWLRACYSKFSRLKQFFIEFHESKLFLQACNFIKNRLRSRSFPVYITISLRTAF